MAGARLRKDQYHATINNKGATYVFDWFAEREEGQVLRVITKIQVRSDSCELRQLRLDSCVNVCLVIHMRREKLASCHALSTWRCRPEVVLYCARGCSSSGNLHALFFFELARFVLGFAPEKVFPPLGDGKDSVHTLESVSDVDFMLSELVCVP